MFIFHWHEEVLNTNLPTWLKIKGLKIFAVGKDTCLVYSYPPEMNVNGTHTEILSGICLNRKKLCPKMIYKWLLLQILFITEPD